jgi:D-aminoacyl-tRNA deacylase
LTNNYPVCQHVAMIALIQRVSEANVEVDTKIVGAIHTGLLALIAVQPGDDETRIQRMSERLLSYRVFNDGQGKMNLSLRDVGGGLLLVSQFTLAANTNSGKRPSFSSAASPDEGLRGFERLISLCRQQHPTVETGLFGANMKVRLVNDGPVTFWLET